MVRLIKRYGSRKLYDTEESRYVSLEELAEWIREGQEIRVVDKATSQDVTSQTLTQVIAEQGRRDQSFPPSDILHQIIRRGEELVTSGVGQISQGVDRLLQAGAEHVGPLRDVREETRTLRRRLEDLELTLARMVEERPERGAPVTTEQTEKDDPTPATVPVGAAERGEEERR